MKLLIINNLASGYGEGAVYDFIRSLARDGDEVCMRSTDGTTDLRGMLDDASSFDAVVASGGDGTVATVSYLLTGTGIPILPFPAGTANLLALNLASPNEPHALAKILRAGATLDFDLGEIEVQGQRFGFGIMAGAGYDALIMHGAEPAKRLLGPMAYFSAALSNPLPQTARFAIELDGETIERDGLGILIVNFSKIQFDISVTHKNQPRDGVLDVVVLRAGNAFELIPAVLAGLLDRGGDFPDRTDSLEIHQARQVRVERRPPHGGAVRRRGHTAHDAVLGTHPAGSRPLRRVRGMPGSCSARPERCRALPSAERGRPRLRGAFLVSGAAGRFRPLLLCGLVVLRVVQHFRTHLLHLRLRVGLPAFLLPGGQVLVVAHLDDLQHDCRTPWRSRP